MVSFDDIRTMQIHQNTFNSPHQAYFTQAMIAFCLLSASYSLFTYMSQMPLSVMSLIGMYYLVGDMSMYYYHNYIKNSAENSEAENDIDDETENMTDMMPSLFQAAESKLMSSDFNLLNNDQRNMKALQQLRTYETKIRQKNDAMYVDDEDFSDLPDLISLDAGVWNSSNLLYYMNPNLRQPGQYCPSLNETHE